MLAVQSPDIVSKASCSIPNPNDYQGQPETGEGFQRKTITFSTSPFGFNLWTGPSSLDRSNTLRICCGFLRRVCGIICWWPMEGLLVFMFCPFLDCWCVCVNEVACYSMPHPESISFHSDCSVSHFNHFCCSTLQYHQRHTPSICVHTVWIYIPSPARANNQDHVIE